MRWTGSTVEWTGSTVDLIELLYGLDTLKYINGGETGMGELLGHIQQENIPSRQKFAEKCLSLQKQS